jgi:chitinase
MFQKFAKILLLIIFSLQIFISGQKKEIIAYYPGYGAAWQSYIVKNLKTSGSAGKITVLIFAFAEPAPDSAGNIVLKPLNPKANFQQVYTADMSIDGVPDDSSQPLRGQFNQLKKLKLEYPGIKILLSIGGWGGGTYFSDAALTPSSRKIFVEDCINKYILGNLAVDSTGIKKGIAADIFDGFDLDWEFPVKGGPDGTHYNANDKENFTGLLKVFREKLNAINPHLILTAAVPAAKPNLDDYDVKSVQKYLDWFNLMTYDYHGSWDKVTAHHTNLFSSPADTTDYSCQLSLDKTVRYFIDSLGVNGSKLVPGAAFYGKCWFNVDSTNNGLYQPGKDSASAPENYLSNYSNFNTLQLNGCSYFWDTLAMAPWLYNRQKKIFWTFDDPKSIALKSRYVDAYDLRGLMFWEISGDDSAGSLVNTIYTRNMPDIKIDKARRGKSIPVISISQPRNEGAYSAGSSVIINTNETGRKSRVIKVEFFGDNVSLGYDTRAPFDWVWFNVPGGRHKIKAVATDENGNTKTSNAITIYVN